METFDVRKMKARLTLRPGQRGTKRLMAMYGDRLVCVRYRYDVERQKRVTTVEIMLEETDWTPNPKKKQTPRRAEPVVVGVRIDLNERDLQRAVKAAGGKWNAKQQVWELAYHDVVRLGLQYRVGEEMRKHLLIDTR